MLNQNTTKTYKLEFSLLGDYKNLVSLQDFIKKKTHHRDEPLIFISIFYSAISGSSVLLLTSKFSAGCVTSSATGSSLIFKSSPNSSAISLYS